MKRWFKAAGIRALRTMAQTALATMGTTAVLADVNWMMVLSTAVMSGIISVLTCIAGLPELKNDNKG